MKRLWKVFNPRGTVQGEQDGQSITGATCAQLADRCWRYYGIDIGMVKDVQADIRKFGSSNRGGVRVVVLHYWPDGVGPTGDKS